MIIGGEHLQSIWYELETDQVQIVDQTRLPHEFQIVTLSNLDDACHAIESMQVRGAPLIGVTAAYGVYLALREDPKLLDHTCSALAATRPTAVNLQWALARCHAELESFPIESRCLKALELAQLMEKEDIAVCEAMGEYGADLLEQLWQEKKAKRKVSCKRMCV